ncbi:MAG: ATP synthase F0 subunit C [Eubacterium sp.]|nr:ATP synthase F0 subunit C [Eubacterium sp.]
MFAALAFFSAAAPAGITKAAETATEETAEEEKDNSTGAKAIAAAIAIGLAAGAGAVAMGIAVAKSNEGIARQPEAAGNIRTTMFIGIIFIETAIIYALVISILIVFVL